LGCDGRHGWAGRTGLRFLHNGDMSIGPPPTPTEVFERERPRLVGLAYRMLGTVTDAEDVVQDAWLRWQTVDADQLERPEAWLTTVTTRVALDHLRSIRRRRETYVGPWLPEPLVSAAGPEGAAVLADSLRLGFLTVLDELAPVERAVFLLADVFAVPFAEIAATVDKSEVACRQIASRARRRVRQPTAARDPATERAITDELMTAIAVGDVAQVLERLAPDVVCVADGGSTRRAARRPVIGAPRVARLLINLAHRYRGDIGVRTASVNGDAGAVIVVGGEVDLVIAFEVRDHRVVAVRVVRNPDKLAHVDCPVPME
jgi:RNA polymerase sigma-70 factor, ECF subfamily